MAAARRVGGDGPQVWMCDTMTALMGSTRRTVLTPFVHALVVIGVVACLCFSAGEGLRLTPLPTLPLPDEDAASTSLPNVSPARGTSLNRTGPLDVPAQGQLQKRGKRQTPDCDCPPSGGLCEVPLRLLRHPCATSQTARASRLKDARPPGRGPPFVS